MLQNEYLTLKIGVDTAENEPLKVLTSFFNIFQSCPSRRFVLWFGVSDMAVPSRSWALCSSLRTVVDVLREQKGSVEVRHVARLGVEIFRVPLFLVLFFFFPGGRDMIVISQHKSEFGRNLEMS